MKGISLQERITPSCRSPRGGSSPLRAEVLQVAAAGAQGCGAPCCRNENDAQPSVSRCRSSPRCEAPSRAGRAAQRVPTWDSLRRRRQHCRASQASGPRCRKCPRLRAPCPRSPETGAAQVLARTPPKSPRRPPRRNGTAEAAEVPQVPKTSSACGGGEGCRAACRATHALRRRRQLRRGHVAFRGPGSSPRSPPLPRADPAVEHALTWDSLSPAPTAAPRRPRSRCRGAAGPADCRAPHAGGEGRRAGADMGPRQS
jgi:hypothetical protein